MTKLDPGLERRPPIAATPGTTACTPEPAGWPMAATPPWISWRAGPRAE